MSRGGQVRKKLGPRFLLFAEGLPEASAPGNRALSSDLAELFLSSLGQPEAEVATMNAGAASAHPLCDLIEVCNLKSKEGTGIKRNERRGIGRSEHKMASTFRHAKRSRCCLYKEQRRKKERSREGTVKIVL